MNSKGNEQELADALEFARGQRLAVLSTASTDGVAEAALMGIAVTEAFELIFDTLKTTRKYPNLKANPRVALVIGCSGAVSLQYEGIAEELAGETLDRYLEVYFRAFPDGRERQHWPGMTYFAVHPKWLRYCDYRQPPPRIREFTWD
jgi:general stress protein 26